MKKRVWCLYRVSTRKQVSIKDDIPAQKKACHNFVKEKADWEIKNELYEKGVSAWSKKEADRDELSIIKNAAIKKEFDILLVFMLDRLGRNEDESPLIVKFLHEHNIEVWSVSEGKRSVESHVDKLLTYISFWQSSGESLKTSVRVTEAKEQLANEGYFQGGIAPYGYKIVETDQIHWKKKDKYVKELSQDEYEAEIVKLIYDWYVNFHCGYRKIVDKLNSQGYRGRDNKPFRTNTIQRVLTRSIYIGLPEYKGKKMPYNNKLRIITDEMYQLAEKIRNKRVESLKEQDKEGIPLKGKLVFSGLGYCGYCGSKLNGSYLYRNDKVGNKEYKNIVYRYRCPLNKGAYAEKHEKSMWGAKKFDKIIIEQVKVLISMIDNKDFLKTNVDKKHKQIELKNINIENLNKERQDYQKQIDKLNSEIANSLLGKSAFTPVQLSEALTRLNENLKEINNHIDKLTIEIDKESNNYSDINILADEIVNWEEKFDNADEDLKKAMLSRIIDRIEFFKDDVNIHLNIKVNELLN